MKFIGHLLLLAMLSALSGAVWVAHRPASADVEMESDASGGKVPDLSEKIRQAAIKRTAAMEVTEEVLNRYLNDRLKTQTPASIEAWTQFDQIRVELMETGVARIHLGWKVWGQLRTVSANLTVVRDGDLFRVQVKDGSYGHLKVIRGLLRPMVPTFRRVGDVFAPDIEHLFRMNTVKIQAGKLVLDPRF